MPNAMRGQGEARSGAEPQRPEYAAVDRDLHWTRHRVRLLEMGGKGGADDPQREAGERVGDLLAGVWRVRAEPTGHAQADAADGQGDEGLVVDRERARGLPVTQHLPEQLPGLLPQGQGGGGLVSRQRVQFAVGHHCQQRKVRVRRDVGAHQGGELFGRAGTGCDQCLLQPDLDAEREPGTVGTPIEGVQMRVVDDNGNKEPHGETGEIVIRGHNVMKGYWRRPEATDAAIRDGWFHTGDLGRVDQDGYFSIVGRSTVKPPQRG